MKKIFNFRNLFLLALAFSITSCEMDVPNINQPSGSEVIKTREGIISLSVGLRQYYSTNGIAAAYFSPGVTAREMKGVATFTNIIELEAGGTELPTANGNVLTLWSSMQKLMGMSETIIANAASVSTLSGGTLSGIIAHAKLYKAIALGTLVTSFEQSNINTNLNGNATFASRQEVLDEVVRLLDEAIAEVETTPVSSEFQSSVAGSHFDLLNTLYTYCARYSIMAGKYPHALTVANKVNLSAVSYFEYTAITPNPLWNTTSILKYYDVWENLGLPTGLYESADLRFDFYTKMVNGKLTLKGFADTQLGRVPVYIPDEIKLIKAEAILRTTQDLNTAKDLIDEVRTQTTGDPFGVHAGLSAYSGVVSQSDLLLEVYRQRCAELFMSGQRLEDSRRFNRPGPPTNMTERNRNFYPYPDQERNNNPNVPADPAI